MKAEARPMGPPGHPSLPLGPHACPQTWAGGPARLPPMGVRYDRPSWRTLPSWRVFISLTVPGWFCSNTNGSLHQRRTHLELAAQSCCHPNRHLSSVHCFKQENESSGPANHTWSCCDNGALFAFGEAGLLGGGAHVSWHLSRDLNVEGSVCVARNHT